MRGLEFRSVVTNVRDPAATNMVPAIVTEGDRLFISDPVDICAELSSSPSWFTPRMMLIPQAHAFMG